MVQMVFSRVDIINFNALKVNDEKVDNNLSNAEGNSQNWNYATEALKDAYKVIRTLCILSVKPTPPLDE